MTTQTCVDVLVGHTCTIKNVAWDPANPRTSKDVSFPVNPHMKLILRAGRDRLALDGFPRWCYPRVGSEGARYP